MCEMRWTDALRPMTEDVTVPPKNLVAYIEGLYKIWDRYKVEAAIYDRWLAADVFAPDGAGSRADADAPPFVIIQPPPNVTGSLHLGHAQRSTVEDLMIRHARMHGLQKVPG